MSGDIECAFFGAVGRAAELRTSRAGKPWTFFPVAVGKDDAKQWVKVAVFGETAETLCRTLQKGDRVYVEGRLTASVYAPEGQAPRVQLDVAAWKCEKTGQIGRNKVKRTSAAETRREGGARDYQRPFDDELPM